MSSPGKHCLIFSCLISLCALPALSSAQDPAEKPQIPADYIVPPPRTITAELKPEKPKRVVDIHYFENRQACVETFKLEASRIEIHVGQSVSFRSSIQKKCGGRSLTAPIPVQLTFSAKSNKKARSHKKSTTDIQKLTPNGPASSFSHTFDCAGVWQVSVVHKMNETETHTLSFPVTVLP
ncbi:MAG: hypothetical protein IJ165_11930 [Proteobacteria bacterium]|nr:hypothetical protein [Pseudomonadota bacterium]